MEIVDPIHGTITFSKEEELVLNSPQVQRLRSIRQMGFSESAFPGATHTRFLHSIGTFKLAERIFDSLFVDQKDLELMRIKQTFKLACLLHDVGHAPLSHSLEVAMPLRASLKLMRPWNKNPTEQANHEDYTIKMITDSSLTKTLQLLQKKIGVENTSICELIVGHTDNPDYFLWKGLNLFPLLCQLVSSEIDCDRMDYLLRDSYFCGVSYGNYDLNWIISNFTVVTEKKNAYLGIPRKAVISFEDFLLGRYHMFLMVYFHYRSTCLEQLLKRFIQLTNEYSLPSSIDEYLTHDDYHFTQVLKQSKHPLSKRLLNHQIPHKIIESFDKDDHKKIQKVEFFLKKRNIDYIKTSSKGQISKYYFQPEQKHQSLKVVMSKSEDRKKILIDPPILDIHQVSNLFKKYQNAHIIERIHCNLDNLSLREKKEITDLC